MGDRHVLEDFDKNLAPPGRDVEVRIALGARRRGINLNFAGRSESRNEESERDEDDAVEHGMSIGERVRVR